ncbi:MAG: DUF1294 domain-containing protein [Allorhizobium sp.]
MAIPEMLTLLLIVILYNVVVFWVFWWDKNAARNGHWRVRESTLLMLAFFAGSAGALAAQRLLRHKTRKQPFASTLGAIAILHIFVAILIIVVAAAPGYFRQLLAEIATLA